ncbi:hypothetical protein FHT08_000145 [Xanthomonas campestris]|uniref:hypothetical protein n=1 Tax=Xanthomonas sp. CFBP 8151 TaxID=3035310 RepID=UPI00141BED5A|nr:hypothetical protein [Xanthomonas sp. CFBP 8151]NIJ75097.1 hypothetical protein [Xanthomonas sp. CFBP 8151]
MLVDGNCIRSVGQNSLREEIAVVPQETASHRVTQKGRVVEDGTWHSYVDSRGVSEDLWQRQAARFESLTPGALWQPPGDRIAWHQSMQTMRGMQHVERTRQSYP